MGEYAAAVDETESVERILTQRNINEELRLCVE